MAANRSSLNKIDEFISASLLLPQQTCKLTPHEVIGSMNYIESAVGDEIVDFLQHDPDATIETMCAEIPLIGNISNLYKALTRLFAILNQLQIKRQMFTHYSVCLLSVLKQIINLAKTVDLSSLCKESSQYY